MEIEATPQGAEQQTDLPVATNTDAQGDDAALLSAFLAQQEQGSDVIDNGAGDPATQAPEQVPSQPDVFTVKVNGVEKQVSRDDLIANYQKYDASNQRFEEAANMRREAETLKGNFQQQQQVLQNAIDHFQRVAQQWAQEGQPNWQQLLETNPHEYLRQKELWDARAVEMQKAQSAQNYLQQQQNEQQQQFLQQHVAQESQRLLELVPEWKDQGRRQADEKELIDFLSKQGYSQQDLINLNQSRASNIKLALNAMRYEKLVQQAQANGKRVQALPPKVEKPGVANAQAGNRDAYNRLSRTGSIDDAAMAFSELFG